MSFWTMRTLSESVTGHGEIGRTEIGGNQEERENVGKSRVSAIELSPKFTPISHFWRQFSLLAKSVQLLAMVLAKCKEETYET